MIDRMVRTGPNASRQWKDVGRPFLSASTSRRSDR